MRRENQALGVADILNVNLSRRVALDGVVGGIVFDELHGVKNLNR